MENINELREINDINLYLDKLQKMKSKYLIFLVVKDTPGSNMSPDIIKKIHDIGFGSFSKELWRMYIGLIQEGNIIIDYTAAEQEEPLFRKIHLVKSHLLTELCSEAWKNGNKCSVKISGIECAINKRGINLVTYDDRTKTVIDSVRFDSHEKNAIFERKPETELLSKKIQWLSAKHHYDICVTGVWYGANYGSILNGYAAYKILTSMGKNVLMLHKTKSPVHDAELRPINHNVKFYNTYYPKDSISPVFTYDDLELLNDYCDCFCSGSDQIWNYNISFDGNMYLPFVHENRWKISLASSFGSMNDRVPPTEEANVKKSFERFDAISVREDFDRKILWDKYGVDSTVVIDPVFCVDKKEYNNLIEDSQFSERNFILAYILDPSDEKLSFLMQASQALNRQVITLCDGAFGVIGSSWSRYEKVGEFPNLMKETEVVDFLKAFSTTDFVITDSFHGTAFSLIFEKNFISICNAKRGKERFYDLLGRFNLMDRLIDNAHLIWSNEFNEKINYQLINTTIENAKRKTLDWLAEALIISKKRIRNKKTKEHVDNKNNHLNTVATKGNGIKCTGCSACINICPVNALELKPDNLGYYVPSLIAEKCINCGKCIKICPDLNLPLKENSIVPKCYEFIAADKETLFKSSSGGAFTCLAKETFRRKGIVVGASWNEKCDAVRHILIDSESDLDKVRKSKYLQSYLGTTFREIRDRLNTGIFVLFTGCPCQVAGLKTFLGKDYVNLLSVDLLCGNAPSTLFFQKYIEDEVPGMLKKYEFRHKKSGWNSDCVTITFTTTTTTTEVRRGGAQDGYQRLYHNHTMCPPHCENCKYQTLPRYGDITIGDFWWIKEKDQAIDEKNGVSAVLCNNEKGQNFFDSILENEIKVKKDVPVEWLKGNGFVPKGHNWCSPQRDAFYNAIQKMSFSKAADFALKPNHGIYEDAFSSSNSPLQYNAESLHFKFDSAVWEEHFINGATVLMVKPGQSKRGRFSKVAFCKELKKGKNYKLAMGFRINTESDVINFHIKDSGSNLWQLVYSKKLAPEERNGRKKISIMTEFIPESGIFDEFMISAVHLKGEENYIAFEYINIQEVNQ